MNLSDLLSIDFEKPEWLWLCALIPVLAALAVKSMAGLDPLRRVCSIVVRSLVIVVAAVCLAEVVRVRTNDNLTVMYVLDRSHSVPDDSQLTAEEYVKQVSRKIPPNDKAGLVGFARQAYVEQPPWRGGIFIDRLQKMPFPDRTDLASAISTARAMFPYDTAKRIVLITDGNENLGDVLAEAASAHAEGIAVDVVPLWYQHANEVYFDRMIAPTNADPDEQVPLRMLLRSRRRTTGQVQVYHNDRLIEMPPEQSRVELTAGSNVFTIRLPVRGGGPQRFEARFIPDDPTADQIVENNVGTAFTFVTGQRKVLLLTTDPEYDQPLYDALLSEKVNVEMVDVNTIDLDLLNMLNYSAIILANVAANIFTEEQHVALASYVSDLGGGLIMTGGSEGFGAGGWIGSPVEAVMPVSFEVKHRRAMPRGALVIIMHSCEFPRANFWGKKVSEKAVDTLSSRDYVGVLAYTWSGAGVNWEVPLQLAANKGAIKQKIQQMQIGDMPDFDSAMNLAVRDLLALKDAAQRHMIIISDGDPSPPSASLLKKMKDKKITCSTVGIGFGAHVMSGAMQRIANATGGKYYKVMNAKKLPQIFVKEAKVIRRPLISEEPFTPRVQHAWSDLLVGVAGGEGEIPQLGGLVMTSHKETAEVSLIRATKEGNDPVLAQWQSGLGKTVAFTSGYWPRWGTEWTRWDKFAKLWAQIVRWVMRQEQPADFEVFTKLEGDQGRIVVEALNKDAGYLNYLNLATSVILPDQSVQRVAFSQTGPGHYEAEFDVDQAGQYIANIAVREGDQSRGSIHTGLSVPFSPEYRDLSTNEALLRQVQEQTGGRWLAMEPELDDVFAHDLPPTVSQQPVWNWVLGWVLLPLFLLDVAVRRLASWAALSVLVEVVLDVFLLFGVGVAYTSWWGVVGVFVLGEVVGWSIRFRSFGPMVDFLTHSVTVLGSAGRRSASSLEQLRTRRDQLRDGVSPSDRDAASEPVGEVKVDRTQRFEAEAEQTAGPVGDIHEALGGAKAGPAAQTAKKPPAPSAAEEEEAGADDVTSRLLRAKRRAREDLDERNK